MLIIPLTEYQRNTLSSRVLFSLHLLLPQIMAHRVQQLILRVLEKLILLKTSRVLLKTPRILLKTPRIVLKAPRILLKIPRILLKTKTLYLSATAAALRVVPHWRWRGQGQGENMMDSASLEECCSCWGLRGWPSLCGGRSGAGGRLAGIGFPK